MGSLGAPGRSSLVANPHVAARHQKSVERREAPGVADHGQPGAITEYGLVLGAHSRVVDWESERGFPFLHVRQPPLFSVPEEVASFVVEVWEGPLILLTSFSSTIGGSTKTMRPHA